MSEGSDLLRISDEVLSSTPVGIAFDRLLSATMFAISLGLGAGNPPPYWNKDILTEAWERKGEGLIHLAEAISSKPRKSTEALFKCELLKWSKGKAFFSYGFKGEGSVAQKEEKNQVDQKKYEGENSTSSSENEKNAPSDKESKKNNEGVSLMLFASWVKKYKESVPY